MKLVPSEADPGTGEPIHAECDYDCLTHGACTVHNPVTPDAGDAALKAAIERGLRKSRHEEAPVPIIREGDIFHITHMVFEEVKRLV